MRENYDKYEAARNVKPCIIDKELIGYRLTKYLVNKKVTKNKNLTIDLFDEVVIMKKAGESIHAIGLRGLKPTVLIFEK